MKVQPPPRTVVFVPHHNVSLPVGVQMPAGVAAGPGLPGGGAQVPLPPPPALGLQPPLASAAPPPGALVPPHPNPPIVPNSTPNGGHIPSLLSLPVAPPKSFTQNSEYLARSFSSWCRRLAARRDVSG